MESREIEEVTSNLKDDVFETLIQAMKRSNEGDVEEALAICKRVITDDGECAEAFFVMAIIAYNLSDQGQAVKMAKKLTISSQILVSMPRCWRRSALGLVGLQTPSTLQSWLTSQTQIRAWHQLFHALFWILMRR